MTGRNSTFPLVLAALLTLPAIGAAQSEVRLVFGPDSPYAGPPIYAQISYFTEFGWEIYHDGDWAAIPFYRDPECVPPDFNLLDMFDFGAAGCPLTVRGFEIWMAAAPPPPIKTRFWGLGAVPIYFVRLSTLQEAVADFRLTMPELEALVAQGREVAVVGTATFYSSELHPSGGTAVPHMEISASGVLQDGRRFQLQVAGGDQEVLLKHVRIVFGTH